MSSDRESLRLSLVFPAYNEGDKIVRSLDYVLPITLGPRILRAETAVVSALTLWQSQVGDWQKAPYLPET